MAKLIKTIPIYLMIYNIAGFSPNIMFNLSKIDINYENESLNAIYDLIILDAIFPLSIDSKSHVILQKNFILHSSLLVYLNITFRNENKIWSQRLQNVYRPVSCSKMIIEELKMDDILNDIFKCKSRVSGYIGRFYSNRTNKNFVNKIFGRNSVQVPVKIPIYWLITRKDKFFHKNKRNFENFIKECNEKPQFMSYLFVFWIFTFFISFLNIVIQCYIC